MGRWHKCLRCTKARKEAAHANAQDSSIEQGELIVLVGVWVDCLWLLQTINEFEMLPRVTEPGPRSIKLSPPATGKKAKELTDWADPEEDYKGNLRQSIVFPSLRRVLNRTVRHWRKSLNKL